MVLELARPSEARCFAAAAGNRSCPPAGDFFEAVFEAVLLQQPQATEAVEKGCFSRISLRDVRQFLQQPQATEAVVFLG